MNQKIAATPAYRAARRARHHADLMNCLAFAAECAGETWQATRLVSDATRLNARADKLSRQIRQRL